MSRRKQQSTEVEITLDRRFLFGFLGALMLVLALAVGVLVGQLQDGAPAAPAAGQPAAQGQFQQPAVPQTNQQIPQAQNSSGGGGVQAQPQTLPSGGGDELTEADATGLVAGDVMKDPCFVINLLEFQKNTVAADFRITKGAPTDEAGPQLAVEGLNARCGNAFDFGQMGPTEVGQQTFALKNVGNEPLTVTGLYTSCGCTVAQVEGHEVDSKGVLSPPIKLAPNESKEFMIALDAKQVQDSKQPRIVQIFSDDPRGVPFGELWPAPGQDRELRFAIVADVQTSMGGGH